MSSSDVSKNAVVKVITIGLTTLIEIWYTRILISSLGVDLYGLLPLATNVIMFGAIINLTMISSLGRFITIEVHRGDYKRASEYYSSGSLLILIICLALLVISTIISWYAPVVFNIPVGHENATRFLFAAILLSFIVSFWVSTMTVGTFIYNRLYLNDWLNFGKVVCSRTMGIILIVFMGFGLSGISFGLISATVLTLLGGIYIHNKLTPEFQVRYSTYRKDFANKLMRLGGWILLRQLSVRILIFADLFIVNYLYGASKSGLYAIAFFFPSKLRIVTGPFAGLLKPVILNRYAKKDFIGMGKIACQGIRLVGVFFAFPVGVFCGLYRLIFIMWVGPQYQSLCWLAVILTCHVSLNISCYPLFAIQDAFNRVKIPSLFSCLMAVVYFLLAFSFTSSYIDFGVAGVALAGAVSLTINHTIFNPFYTSLLLKISPWKFYKSFLPGVIGSTIIAISLYFIQYNIIEVSIYKIVFLIFVSGIIYCLIAWYLLLSAPEREFLGKSLLDLKTRFTSQRHP